MAVLPMPVGPNRAMIFGGASAAALTPRSMAARGGGGRRDSPNLVAMASDRGQQRLSPALVLLMAVASGAAVANIYYAQPLLDTIGHDFSVSDGTAGLLVTASQVGYAAGLIL